MGAARPSARSAWLAYRLWAWIVVAMVMAQTLGFTHDIVHSPVPQLAHQAGAQQTAGDDKPRHVSPQQQAGTNWLATLFGAHGSTSDCRLYDHFSHGDSLTAPPAPAMPALALPVFLRVFDAPLPLARAALVRVRGPPCLH